MKQLGLKNQGFIYVEQSFKEWLDILGYSSTTVYYMPLHIREFLSYLEDQNINELKSITTEHLQNFYHQLKTRPNVRRGGGLSNAYINKYLQALKLFSNYLRQSGRLKLPSLLIKRKEQETNSITVLSPHEIEDLYDYTEGYNIGSPIEFLNSRDKAMLSVLYGCGLRRNEAVHVNVSDIYFDQKLLHVRKGKNYKERLVPISKRDNKYIRDWVYDWRPSLIKNGRTTDALFLNQSSKRLGGQSMLNRLNILKDRSDDIELREKEIGLHTLRHSIATHLLQNGMPIEQIQIFLGHSSLESTQIYTHLIEKETTIDTKTNIAEYENI